MSKKRKYDRILWYSLAFLLLLGIIGTAIDSSDLDDFNCNNTAILKLINGTWGCSETAFGELIITNDTTISLPLFNTYYNITNMTLEHSHNVNSNNNSYFNITKAGNYKITAFTSFSGGGNTEYEMEVFINEIGHDHCELHRKMGTGGDVGSASLGCFEAFDVGDIVSIKVSDNTNPSQNINIHHLSFIIQEIQ